MNVCLSVGRARHGYAFIILYLMNGKRNAFGIEITSSELATSLFLRHAIPNSLIASQLLLPSGLSRHNRQKEGKETDYNQNDKPTR